MTDQRAIDVLVHKSRLEFQETMNLWKQNDHVLGILLADEGPKEPKTFLQKFYEGGLVPFSSNFVVCILTDIETGISLLGRDEDAVLPAATGTR